MPRSSQISRGCPRSTPVERRRRCALLVAGLALVLHGAPVLAAPVARGCTHEPWIELAFDGPGWSSRLQSDTLADLRAGLRLRAIEVCAAGTASEGSTPAPVARVVLHALETSRRGVGIEIQDAVTEKRVLRDVDLQRVSPDARGLTLAQAVDELLRASWIELTMHPEPKTGVPASPAIQLKLAELAAPVRPKAERLQVLGARFAAELYSGGLTLIGADAQIAFWVTERLALSVLLGLRTGVRERSAHGTLEASAITAGASLQYPVFARTSRYNLLMSLGAHAGELTLTGHGSAQTRTQSRSVLLVTARLGASAIWRVSDILRLELAVGPGLALRGVTATDTGRDVVSTRGVELHAALGIGGQF